MRRKNEFFAGLLVAAMAASMVWGQGPISGTLEGTVKDPQGGVLPGVTVTVSSAVLVQGKATTVTDSKGQFRFPALPPGFYTLEAELSGFKTLQLSGVKVNLGQTTRLDSPWSFPP